MTIIKVSPFFTSVGRDLASVNNNDNNDNNNDNNDNITEDCGNSPKYNNKYRKACMHSDDIT